MKVVHLINGLGMGGAETMLFNIVTQGEKSRNAENVVVTLGKGDYFVDRLRDNGVDVHELNLASAPVSGVRTLIGVLRDADAVCSWSYHTNILSLLAKTRRGTHLSWIINHADLAWRTNKPLTWMIMRLCAATSRVPDVIAFNGEASRDAHLGIGFRPRAKGIAPTGCDTDVYSPQARSREYLQEQTGVDADRQKVVISAGRWDPIKDHPTLLRALAIVKEKLQSPVVALLCGPDVTADNPELVDHVEGAGLEVGKDVLPLGPRDDLAQLMATSDLFVLHSKSEAFPNVVIQAMAAGTRVVSTDVGVVGELTNGALERVAPGDSGRLAEEMLNQLTATEPQLDREGRTLRQIVVDDYSLHSVSAKYEAAIFP